MSGFGVYMRWGCCFRGAVQRQFERQRYISRDAHGQPLVYAPQEAALTRVSRMRDAFNASFTLDENKTPR